MERDTMILDSTNRGLEYATIKRVETQLPLPLSSLLASLSAAILSPTTDVDTSTLVCSVNKLNKAPVRLSPCIVQYTRDSSDTGMAHEFRNTSESSA